MQMHTPFFATFQRTYAGWSQAKAAGVRCAGCGRRAGLRERSATRVGHQHLFERRMPLQMLKWPDPHAGLTHVDQREAGSRMLPHISVGSSHHNSEVHESGADVPDSLPVGAVSIPLPFWPGVETGEVGIAAGLAEQLTPVLLAGDHGVPVTACLVICAVRQDGLRRQSALHTAAAQAVDGAVCARPLTPPRCSL